MVSQVRAAVGSGEGGNSPSFLAGGGEMGALIRAQDWSSSPLGEPAAWPQSLKTVVRIMLTSRYAMWMGWGEELTFFYNDAYRPTLGVKHPGRSECRPRRSGRRFGRTSAPASRRCSAPERRPGSRRCCLFLERNGYPEETYHTFSYSPLAGRRRRRGRHALRGHRGNRTRHRRAAIDDFAGARLSRWPGPSARRGLAPP